MGVNISIGAGLLDRKSGKAAVSRENDCEQWWGASRRGGRSLSCLQIACRGLYVQLALALATRPARIGLVACSGTVVPVPAVVMNWWWGRSSKFHVIIHRQSIVWQLDFTRERKFRGHSLSDSQDFCGCTPLRVESSETKMNAETQAKANTNTNTKNEKTDTAQTQVFQVFYSILSQFTSPRGCQVYPQSFFP